MLIFLTHDRYAGEENKKNDEWFVIRKKVKNERLSLANKLFILFILLARRAVEVKKNEEMFSVCMELCGRYLVGPYFGSRCLGVLVIEHKFRSYVLRWEFHKVKSTPARTTM